jgi:hypothetical protein
LIINKWLNPNYQKIKHILPLALPKVTSPWKKTKHHKFNKIKLKNEMHCKGLFFDEGRIRIEENKPAAVL